LNDDIAQAILVGIGELKASAEVVNNRLQGIEARIAALDTKIGSLEDTISSWPDLNFLQASVQQLLSEAKDAREFRRRTDIKLDEIYGSMATDAEITKLREEVSLAVEHERQLDLRLSAIENRLRIKNPFLTE